MKLYFSRGACSLSPHIVLRELGLDFELVTVDLRSKQTSSGEDFSQVSPNGYVPALRIDEGHVLTEGPAIVQYLADQKPESKLAPANGTMARYYLQSALNFISTELHKGFSPLFNPAVGDDAKEVLKGRLSTRVSTVNGMLADKQFLLGDQFTVADAYLFTVLSWSRMVKLDLSGFPNVEAYLERVRARPAVKAAMEAERQAAESAPKQ